MAAPIVYLDTQDFIRFRNNLDDAEIRKVFDYLRTGNEAGRFHVGYSFYHITEFITPPGQSKFLQDRQERGQLIKDICGAKAFPFITDIGDGARFPNDGFWIPRRSMPKINIHETMIKTVTRAINSLENKPNRALRRRLKTMSGLREVIKSTRINLSPEDLEKNGLNTVHAQVLAKYFAQCIRGEISELAVQRKLYSWMNDPSEFAHLWYEFGGRDNALEEFIKKPLAVFGEMIQNYIKTFNEYSEMVSGANSARRDLEKDLKEIGISKVEIAKILPSRQEIPKPAEWEVSTKIDTLLSGRLRHFIHYTNKRFRGIGKFEENDLADLSHMIHAYDSDLFRCDRKMHNIFSDFHPFSGKLVCRLQELPERIENWIREH